MTSLDLRQSTWSGQQYRLLDFGHGRKLEKFGRFIFDRPCPAAQGVAPHLHQPWTDADFRLNDDSTTGFDESWIIEFQLNADVQQARQGEQHDSPPSRTLADASICKNAQLSFELRLTPFGHVGIFPEQAGNWRWLYDFVRKIQAQPVRCLNLFAYTGASTLAMSAAGAEVVHIDSSAPSVQWARRNCQLSGLEHRPIRWIVEDAYKFVQREIRRGNQYHLVVLDPPAYGHTPGGRAWKLESTWNSLLSSCLELLRPGPSGALLWTGHSPTPSIQEITQAIQSDSRKELTVETGPSDLVTDDSRRLNHGYFVRASSV